VGVLAILILTVTANHTKRNLQQVPGMTCERSIPYSVLLSLPAKEDRSQTCSRFKPCTPNAHLPLGVVQVEIKDIMEIGRAINLTANPQ
jgi:hypothetical protein